VDRTHAAQAEFDATRATISSGVKRERKGGFLDLLEGAFEPLPPSTTSGRFRKPGFPVVLEGRIDDHLDAVSRSPEAQPSLAHFSQDFPKSLLDDLAKGFL
jgi:hypothetical protein